MDLQRTTSMGCPSDLPYTIHVRKSVLTLSPHNLLEQCWTTGLDTPCSVCKNRFDNSVAPPVRTLHLVHAIPRHDNTNNDLPAIKISNTHLACLKAKDIKFFPTSHAWHDPVARAYASRESNYEAARLVFELPVRILIAASRRFGPNVQIWHDYISIPQWQDNFRGTTILPQIFQIFKYGGTALIHLDDEPTFDIHTITASQDLLTHASMLQCLFNARWFKRMWIIIEFAMCQDSYLMNSRFEIMPYTFSSLMEQIAATSLSLPAPLEWMTTIPLFSKDRSAHNCLGHVFDLLASQGCRSYRDKFIAACAMLEPEDEHRALPQLPGDAEQACLWVSKRALERGDYSPLLLGPSEEPQYKRVRWLKGHAAMNVDMWGLGVQTHAADVPPRILSDDSVELELHLLGNMVDAEDQGGRAACLSAQCPTCDTTTSFRASMWQKPGVAAMLYRIPGLAYLNMSSKHIGIVVEDSRITGRARLDLFGCLCNARARIYLD